MAHLTFKFGAMGSTKTRQLMAIYYNFKYDCDLNPFVIKPSKDKRDGIEIIRSRDGSELVADLVASRFDNLLKIVRKELPDIVLVDEGQFLSKDQIIQLRKIVDIHEIPVIVFGIKNDAFNEMFEGATYLFVYADKFEQIKTICRSCKKNSALMNMRLFNGRPIFKGQQVMTGGDDKYIPVCSKCYHEIKEAKETELKDEW